MGLNKLLEVEEKVLRVMMPYLQRRTQRRELRRAGQSSGEYFLPVDKDVEHKHIEMWSRFCRRPALDWLRFLSNVSGIVDYRYCPHDLFLAHIDPVLNDYNRREVEYDDKNMLDKFIGKGLAPNCVLRYIRGMFFDSEYNWISVEQAEKLLKTDHGDLIGKVCVGSLGGHGVTCWRYSDVGYVDSDGEKLSTSRLMTSKCLSYVLQSRIKQCEFSAQFNKESANTFRMVTLRCPWDGRVVLLRSAMRIGVTQAAVDNLSSGGISVCVDDKGWLSPFGYSWVMNTDVRRYTEHPVSHIKFKGQQHPFFDKMKETVCEAAKAVPYLNILGWDVLVDANGDVKIVEVNAASIGTDWLQYDFGPLFGNLTEKVIDWCAEHQSYCTKRYVRL